MKDNTILFHLCKDEGKRTVLVDTMFPRQVKRKMAMKESLRGTRRKPGLKC
jgi:hypothetical protein